MEAPRYLFVMQHELLHSILYHILMGEGALSLIALQWTCGELSGVFVIVSLLLFRLMGWSAL